MRHRREVVTVTTGQRATRAWPEIDCPLGSEADVRRARRVAVGEATRQGFSTAGTERVAQVAAELATHLVAHQGTGRLLIRGTEGSQRSGVELLHWTSDTGTALGAGLQRILVDAPDVLEVYTAPGTGTVLLAQVWRDDTQPGPDGPRFLVGSMADPIEGESVSGDAWAVEQRGARMVALVSDGLGHGAEAAAASSAAVSALRAHHLEPVEQVAACVHVALRHTRGAAIGVAEVDRDAGLLRFCGIGNVTARLLTGDGSHELVSQYGIAGYRSPRIHTTTRPWPDDAMLVMHSDGLSSRWDVGRYPHLRLQHPQIVATTLMHGVTRAHDDAVVLTVHGAGDAGSTLAPAGLR